MELLQQAFSPTGLACFVFGGDDFENGGKGGFLRLRPKVFIGGDPVNIGERREERVIRQGLQLVDESVRLRIKLLKIIAKTGVQIIEIIGLGKGGQQADQVQQGDAIGFLRGADGVRPLFGMFLVQVRVVGRCRQKL